MAWQTVSFPPPVAFKPHFWSCQWGLEGGLAVSEMPLFPCPRPPRSLHVEWPCLQSLRAHWQRLHTVGGGARCGPSRAAASALWEAADVLGWWCQSPIPGLRGRWRRDCEWRGSRGDALLEARLGGLLTLLSVHPVAAGPAFVPQNHGVHHPLLPLGQGHPSGTLSLEVVRCISPEGGVSTAWPDLALRWLPACCWAEGRERRRARRQRPSSGHSGFHQW